MYLRDFWEACASRKSFLLPTDRNDAIIKVICFKHGEYHEEKERK